ncbi:MAG: RNA polymerase sigma factor [Deltaproteobacteria bacterium]|jgi:RNA polymerase sigma-70 factor (ECF subfamily)|nr:RNA polymerase sigma factor [Deltaproteobacteria bacterium]
MQQRASAPEDERGRESALVERVLAGDEGAFSDLYEAYYRRVYAFTLKRTGDAAEAEDLTQETFVQLYRSLGSFQGRSSLLTWTFGIAHNICSRHFRYCSRWMVGSRNARALKDSPSEARIERWIDASRALERCHEVLEESRRPAHREIFRLRYAQRQSIRAIADRVGKSSDAVKVSLRRSLAAIAKGVPELDAVLDGFAQSA